MKFLKRILFLILFVPFMAAIPVLLFVGLIQWLITGKASSVLMNRMVEFMKGLMNG
jgi:hypothetical protein